VNGSLRHRIQEAPNEDARIVLRGSGHSQEDYRRLREDRRWAVGRAGDDRGPPGELLAWAAGVKVAHPQRLKVISEGKKKADRIDAEVLCDLPRVDLSPEAYMADAGTRELRRALRFFPVLRCWGLRQRPGRPLCVHQSDWRPGGLAHTHSCARVARRVA